MLEPQTAPLVWTVTHQLYMQISLYYIWYRRCVSTEQYVSRVLFDYTVLPITSASLRSIHREIQKICSPRYKMMALCPPPYRTDSQFLWSNLSCPSVWLAAVTKTWRSVCCLHTDKTSRLVGSCQISSTCIGTECCQTIRRCVWLCSPQGTDPYPSTD
jgi:hypothetical protein